MEIRGDTNITELLIQSFRRIDGITMYGVCLFFVLLSAYAKVAQWYGFPLFISYSNAAFSIVLTPIVFIVYIRLASSSGTGKISRLFNSIILLIIPFIYLYKSLPK